MSDILFLKLIYVLREPILELWDADKLVQLFKMSIKDAQDAVIAIRMTNERIILSTTKEVFVISIQEILKSRRRSLFLEGTEDYKKIYLNISFRG